MSGMNRSVFCLACGKTIAEADLATHITSYPNHALIPYHHNIPLGGANPIGAIVSGSLNGSKRLHVDGSRTDTDTPESGSPAQPFRTIQGAVDYGVATFAGPFTISIEQALYAEEVVMPDYVAIDCPVGAVLRRPPGPAGDALTVTGTYGDPEPAFGATVIRGLRIASDGDDGLSGTAESWCVRVTGDSSGPDTREPFVVLQTYSLDAYNEGNYLLCEGGGFFLTGNGGMGGDDTGGVGVRLKPAAGLGAMCITGEAMIGFGSVGLDIYENAFFVGNGCRFQTNGSHSSPTKTVINMDASAGFSLVSIYQPSSMFGDPDHFIKAVGSGGGGPPSALIALHGGYNDIFDGMVGDAVDIRDGVLFRFVDGGIRSAGGRGIVVDDAVLWIRNANVVSGDGLTIDISGDYSHVESIDTTYEGHVSGGAYGPVAKVDVAAPSVSFVGGNLHGDVRVLDVQRGGVWLLGGVDIDCENPVNVAYNVAAAGQILRGHANVRKGQRVVAPGASEYLFPSGFGELTVGFFNCISKIGSQLTPPGGGAGYEVGSLWIHPSVGLYQNIGTEAAPIWKPISNQLLSGSGDPNGVVDGFAGLIYRDTATDDFYICVADSSQIWKILGGGGGGGVASGEIFVAEHREASGVGGGAFNSGAWRTRSLNTEVYNDSPDIAINTGTYEIVLNKGFKYLVQAVGVADNVDDHQIAFEVDGALVLFGSSERTSNTLNITSSSSSINGVVDLRAAPTNMSCYLKHRTTSSGTFGDAGGYGSAEVYARVTIQKMAPTLAPASFISGAGDPRVVPVIGVAGQIYKDTAAGIYYVCEADGTSLWGVL